MARLKPPYPQAIDPRWLGLGLKAAWAFSEGAGSPRDALNRLAATLASSEWGYGSQGANIVHDATTDRTELAAASSTLLPTADITIILGSRKTDSTNRDSGAFGVDTATAAEYCAVKLPAADGTVYWDYGGVTEGTTRLTAAALTFGDDTFGLTVGPRGMEIWQNGQLRASNAANPTRTATSAAFKLGLYDSALGGDLAAYNCIYVFAGQLSPDDIALLTSDPSRLFTEQHQRSKWTVFAGAQSILLPLITTLRVIQAGRLQRPAKTQTAPRVTVYGFMDSQHTYESYTAAYGHTNAEHALQATALSYGFLDAQHVLDGVVQSYGFLDGEHVFEARTQSYGYLEAQHAFNAFAALYGYQDGQHVHTAGANAYGAVDAEHQHNAYALSFGYLDAQQEFNAYLTAYGHLDASHGFNAYTAWYGALDGEHGYAAYTPLYGYADGSHAMLLFGLPQYGYHDASHQMEVRALARGFADAQHVLETYALSYGATDAQHDFGAYTTLLGYHDAVHALSVYAGAYGYLDAQHLLDTTAAFYGWVLNQMTGAASRYEGFDFNSMTEAAGRYLAASSAGIHELGGSDDVGVAIGAVLLTGDLDFGSEMQKRLTDAYVGGEASGELKVIVSADGVPASYTLAAGTSTAVKNRKIDLGRGAKGRYWRLDLQNVQGAAFEADAITLLPEILSRRK